MVVWGSVVPVAPISYIFLLLGHFLANAVLESGQLCVKKIVLLNIHRT